MDLKVNLHITVDPELLSLLSKFGSANGQDKPKVFAKVAPVNDDPEEEEEEEVPVKKSTISVEKLREAASKLMAKDKTKLKAILTKYDSKTVAALDDADLDNVYKDITKALGGK